MDNLLEQGIAAYKAGKRDEARKIFIVLVKQEPDNERAWGWMYQVSNNDQERIHCMKQALRINPANEKAKQILSSLMRQDFPFEQPQKDNPPIQNAPAKNVLPIDVRAIQDSNNQATKKCPFCAETIQSSAIVCRYCGRDLTPRPTHSVVVNSQPQMQQQPQKILSNGEMTCPHCQKTVSNWATKCPYCHSDLSFFVALAHPMILVISVVITLLCCLLFYSL